MYTFKFQPDTPVQNNGIGFLKVSTSPVIPFPEEITNEITLGDGTKVVRHSGIYSDIDIKIECNYIAETREKYLAYKSAIDRYLGDKKGLLELSEDIAHYWKVKNVIVEAGDRVLKRATDLTITFTCDPYRYFKEYSQPVAFVTGEKTIFNNFYEPSYPIYKIYNDSSKSKTITITNNGKSLSITDPFKGRMISAEEGDKTQEVLYLELDTYWNTLKTVYDGSYEYQTIKTSGRFSNIRFGAGINEVIVDIDLGSCRVEVQREYREL